MKLYLFQNQAFFVFVLCLAAVYWICPSRFRNRLLLVASYVFYGSWDYRFLSLLGGCTVIDYYCATWIARTRNAKRKRSYLILSITVNLGCLAFFKYFNFFLESLGVLFSSLGVTFQASPWNIILPLGISFYTFQALGYMIDVYRGRFAPIRNFWDYALFVAYFPQIIAGPIQRAGQFIPELLKPKHWRQVEWEKAFYLFVYGLFKKVVFADGLRMIVDRIFSDPSPTANQVLFGGYGYALQMYCDFSGYSDMARGVSLLFGITIAKNFEWPFLTQDPSTFWRRWHMTLSAWVRDYMYSPLLVKTRRTYFSLFVAFLTIGIWHGPRWTYVAFGLYWFFLTFLYGSLKPKIFTRGPGSVIGTLVFFQWIALAFLLFRADDLAQFSLHLRSLTASPWMSLWNTDYAVLYTAALFIFVYDGVQARARDEFILLRRSFYLKAVFYAALIFLYRQFGGIADQEFIYFQF